MSAMRDTIKIGDKMVTIHRYLTLRLPDGQWRCYSGGLEATGRTKRDAIYNFRRIHLPADIEVEG